MTLKQIFLKLIYPLWMFYNKLAGRRSKIFENKNKLPPPQSFYDLSVSLNDGTTLSFDSLKGKKVLLVNTASNCGYTNQYGDLQKLLNEEEDKLMIIGFPANDFKEQEKGSDEEIAQFCRINYGVTFPLMKKSIVVKSPEQNEVFQWLTDKNKNGWNDQPPTWNFSKYLVNEEGILTSYFDPSISPISNLVINAIETELK